MSEFTGIQGHDAWRAKLKELLLAAEKAARQEDVEPRFTVAERLTQFIEHSHPNDTSMQAMDSVASRTVSALMDQNINERLKSIAERKAELAGLAKQITAAAAAANETAANLRLERLQRALDAVNGGIRAFKQLEDTLDAGDETALAQAVAAASDAARKLRDLLQART